MLVALQKVAIVFFGAEKIFRAIGMCVEVVSFAGLHGVGLLSKLNPTGF
jgi:hypothetical protein